MKIKKVLLTIGFAAIFSACFVGLAVYKDTPVEASTDCPSTMSDTECYYYLLNQYEDLSKQQGTLQDQLDAEEYKQLSLEDKITYITNQISQTEKAIKTLEVEIAAHNMEIKLLEENIQEKEDSVGLMRQEVDVLEETANQRITELYKYSYLSAFDLFLDSKSFSNVLSKMKYLIATRAQDIKSLEDYSQEIITLKQEEEELSAQKKTLQEKMVAIEEEKVELADKNESLVAQKAEKKTLLAESQAKSEELLSALRKNKALQAELDAAIISWINAHMSSLIKSGPVAQGATIGYVYPGASACSTGAHLHFGIDSKTSGTFSASVDPFNGYLVWGAGSGIISSIDGWNYPYVTSGKYTVPLSGTVIMTQDYHAGKAIDLSKPSGITTAAVRAAYAGTLYRGVDSCGQNYAIIVQKDGKRSIYVHLK